MQIPPILGVRYWGYISKKADPIIVDKDEILHPGTTVEVLPKLRSAVAAVHGHVIGMGFAYASLCDVIVAPENAVFNFPEISVGTAGGPFWRKRVVPDKVARYHFYTAKPFTAREMGCWGAVNKIVPREQLMDAAMELAQPIATKAPLFIMSAKRIIHATHRAAFGAGQYAESEQNSTVSASKDVGEGMRALREKRAPVFHNE